MGTAPVDAGGRGSCSFPRGLYFTIPPSACEDPRCSPAHLGLVGRRGIGPSLSIVMVTGWAPRSEYLEGGRGSVQVTQLWSSLSKTLIKTGDESILSNIIFPRTPLRKLMQTVLLIH